MKVADGWVQIKAFGDWAGGNAGHRYFREVATNRMAIADRSIIECTGVEELDPSNAADGLLFVDFDAPLKREVGGTTGDDDLLIIPLVAPDGAPTNTIVSLAELQWLETIWGVEAAPEERRAATFSYCVQCTDKPSAQVGTFIYEDSHRFCAVSPIFDHLIPLYAWMKENGWECGHDIRKGTDWQVFPPGSRELAHATGPRPRP